MTLTVHLVGSAVRRSWVARILKMVVAVLLQLLHTTRRGLVLARDLRAGLVADGRELDGPARLLVAGRGGPIGGVLAIGGHSGSARALLFGLPLVLLLLLASFPLLSDLLELCLARRHTLASCWLHTRVPRLW